MDEAATWYSRPHPRGPFRVDITGGVSASSQRQFQWLYFVQQRERFQQHIQNEGFHITKFEVVRNTRWKHPVFLGERSDGQMFAVDPWVHATEPSWNTDDIADI